MSSGVESPKREEMDHGLFLSDFADTAVQLRGHHHQVFRQCVFTVHDLLGMTILFVIQKIRRKPITLKLANKWIIFGGIMKACHYLCENYGVMKGNSFGTVIVLPAQTFTVLLFSTFVMKEKMTRQKVFGTLLTIFGVLLLSWNGLPLDTFLNEQAYILWFYLFGGIAAAFFNIAQKKLVDSMDIISMNVSMEIYLQREKRACE